MTATPNYARNLIGRYSDLPASSVIAEIAVILNEGHCVLSAPTGSGKTTLVPLALLALGAIPEHKKIIMLEPRRIAARAAAIRMSSMIDGPVGSAIGYRTRFESKTSANTRIEVVTEGILIRKIQHDPELSDTALIIFDEFHERSLQADLGLALCLDLCELRDDLRLLVMSATLESDPVCRLLGDARHIRASGRSYPVAISYLNNSRQPPPPHGRLDIARLALTGILKAHQEQSGDILAFLPGAGEIRTCLQLLKAQPGRLFAETEILPLYGNLSHQEQDRIFLPKDAKRRIILATPIAETSLTIDGIHSVVDTGFCRRAVHDHSTGLTRLATARISRASADQRAGRAGRTAPGTCYRLWDEGVDHGLLATTPPEIITSELSSLVLELALWGIRHFSQLAWLDAPRQSSWDSAVSLLKTLGCLDKNGLITELGKEAARLPVHPRLGVLLIHGRNTRSCWTSCLLAALLSERDIFRGQGCSADIIVRLQTLWTLAQDRQEGTKVIDPAADLQFCKTLIRQARQLRKLLGAPVETRPRFNQAGSLLASAYPDRIAALRPGQHSSYLLANGSGAELLSEDSLAGTPLLVAAHIGGGYQSGPGRQPLIFLAAAINRSSLESSHSVLLQKVEEIRWDQANGRVNTCLDLRLGSIVLESRKLDNPCSEEVSKAFMQGIAQNGIGILPWNREAREFQARVCSLNSWLPEQWPDISDQRLASDLNWLVPFCSRMRNLNQLKELDMKAILLSSFDWEQRGLLESLAPSHLQVPSGSRIKLRYTPGEAPVLAVRLQELFGLHETPRVCRNTIPLIIHLLSPAQRPIQVTGDLQSFWRNTYPEVRKELAGRYPKHYWPSDPMKAQATRKTKKQMDRQ